MTHSPVFLGIDVGTGSARAGLFNAQGKMLGTSVCPIRMWKPKPDFVEQSSEDIWQACVKATREALAQAAIDPQAVKGIGFDATCSLVALDADDRPVSLSPTGKDEQNVIVWMDHRATLQAERINALGSDVLRYVGGVISPEMETPKLLWVKENLAQAWGRTARFFDLPDFLTYRATGQDVRSLCSTVCKWTYLGHKGLDGAGWDADYFRHVGLGDLVDEGYARIGTKIRNIGEPIGTGLSARAAAELGLKEGIAVGVSIIDAHAGGLGVLGAEVDGKPGLQEAPQRRIALIGGTSSCHMAVSPEPVFVPGVWGPYRSAMVPDLWLTEGGQSATGALIDHVINSHCAAAALKEKAQAQGCTIYQLLNERLEKLAQENGVAFPAELTREFHIQPDFHGNRSPYADPSLKGVMSGLPLSATEDDLAIAYLAAIQAVAHGTRHIIDALNAQGYAIDTIFVCGGGTKNPVFLREHADITGCPLVLATEPEAVLLGASLLGAVAARQFGSVTEAMAAMNCASHTIEPATGDVARFHAKKHKVYLKMHEDFLAYRAIMEA